MTYEETPIKKGAKVNKATLKRMKSHELDSFSTGSMLWYIVKRHKFAIVAIWAVLITVLYMFPFVPDMVFSVVGR